MKKKIDNYFLFVLACFFSLNFLFSQNSINDLSEYYHLKFDKSDGYIIDELNSMEFDDDGWLWLSGISYESRNYKLGVRNPIILRFNGKTFYEVEIPDNILEGTSNLMMQKSFGNSFYLKLEAAENSRLFRLDARSLVFNEIELPESGNKYKPKYELLKLRDRFLYVQQNPNGNKLYYLDNEDKFEFSGTMNTNENIVGARLVELENNIIISKFNFGSELFTKRNKELQNTVINSQTPFSKNTIIETNFYKDSTAYMIFDSDPIIYKYDKESKEIVATSLFSNNNDFVEQIMFQDKKQNSLLKQAVGQQAQLKIFSNFKTDPIWSYKFDNELTNRSIFASRDLTKEIILDNYNVLEVFVFDTDVITTFLKGLSIRSMAPLKEDLILIATDFNGWYLLDLKNHKTSPYWPISNQNKITPQLNRNLYFNDNTIWSNDGSNLLKVDFESRKTQNFKVHNNLSAMVQNQEKIVFADVESTIQTFDKRSHQFDILIDKDSLNYENLIFKNNSIYAATNHGLKHITEQNTELYKPNVKEVDNYVISIIEYGVNQLLIGTRSGKLFVFNIKEQSFKELYSDELSASIASILVDNKNRIWLNTFAGIVVFNPENKETIRFGANDGLSHYEANRFSALKLDNGNFLIGTVKGLNYFHPDSLIASYNKNRHNHKLQFVSIELFDSDKKEVKTILDRDQLNNIKSITLPAENKNLVIDFGILKPRINIAYFYRYRLDNSDWIEIDDKNEIRLLNLESGNYDLKIQALDKTKNEVLSTLPLGLTVEQFFYESIWFYSSLLIIILSIVLIYTFKWRQVNQANYKNKLLRTEIEYKKKDLADFAANISRNQQWNDYLITKMGEIKEAKGRKKGAALINLEKEIKDKNNVMESSFEFQKRIDLLSNEFYNSLLKRYPNLSKTEVKLCSLIRLNLDNHDIATLQNVDVSSVYKSRYRLRKKLNITSDIDLDTFLKAF